MECLVDVSTFIHHGGCSFNLLNLIPCMLIIISAHHGTKPFISELILETDNLLAYFRYEKQLTHPIVYSMGGNKTTRKSSFNVSIPPRMSWISMRRDYRYIGFRMHVFNVKWWIWGMMRCGERRKDCTYPVLHRDFVYISRGEGEKCLVMFGNRELAEIFKYSRPLEKWSEGILRVHVGWFFSVIEHKILSFTTSFVILLRTWFMNFSFALKRRNIRE